MSLVIECCLKLVNMWLTLYYFSELWDLDSDENDIHKSYLMRKTSHREKSHVGNDRASIKVKIAKRLNSALSSKTDCASLLPLWLGELYVKFI